MEEFAILHIEDSSDDAFLFQRAWKKAGATRSLQLVSTAEAAAEYLEGKGPYADRKAHPLPCVIVMDGHIGRGGGTVGGGSGFLRWLREHQRFRTLPVVVLTGSSYRREIDEAYIAGANSVLLKPTCVEEFERTVGLLKAYWLELNQWPSECQAKGH